MTTLFITASDTDVGKTYITTNLLRLFLQIPKGLQHTSQKAPQQSPHVRAIKPVETGFDYSASDKQGVPVGSDVHSYQQVNPKNNYPPAYYFDVPASPHYSARLANSHIDIDHLENYCREHIAQSDVTLIEGAGGLLVPFNHQYNFTHLIKRLNCPIILVVKNQLGAINQALTNIQLCEFHGIDIACVVMNQTNPNDELALENIAFVQSQTDVPVIQVDKDGSFEDFADRFTPIVKNLLKETLPTDNLTTNLTTQPEFDKNHLWHPYTSMTKPLKAYHVGYAEGKYIYIDTPTPPNSLLKNEGELNSKKLLEGMGSWWSVNQGYNQADLNKSAIAQINQFSHVMFGGLTHDPAIELGKTLIKILPNGLEKIFYSDSGSVSVEVAIKMALQYQQAVSLNTPLLTSLRRETAEHRSAPTQDKSYARSTGGETKKTKILTPLGGYHGDTFGAMSVCDPVNGMHGLFKGMLAEQIFIPRPNCPFDKPFDEQCLEPLKQALAKHQEMG